jgi:HPt (histidine-containing phosphotransfer) domain-containing protein
MEASGHDADAAAMPALAAALAQLEETVGDREFVAELIGDFLDGLPAQLAALREASSSRDSGALHLVAHTLKSNAATFGADGLAEACRELEQVARTADRADVHDLLARVDAEAGHAAPALAAARDERSS